MHNQVKAVKVRLFGNSWMRSYWDKPITMAEARKWLREGPFCNVREDDLRFEKPRVRRAKQVTSTG